jgi:hypothetical protein
MGNTSRMNASITHLRRMQPKVKVPEDAGMAPARHAEAFMLIFRESLRKYGRTQLERSLMYRSTPRQPGPAPTGRLCLTGRAFSLSSTRSARQNRTNTKRSKERQ